MVNGAGLLPSALLLKEVQFAIGLSIQTSAISTMICLLLALPTAYFLHQFSYKSWIMPLLYLPLALPHIVSGIALLLFFGHMGIGQWLEKYFKFSFVFTQSGIVLAQLFVNLPFAIKLLTDGFSKIPQKQIFVARTLGANKFQVMKRIILPLMKSTIFGVIILTGSRALGEFGAVIMIAGTTRMKTEVLPTAIMLNISTGDLDLAMSIALILMIISLVCSAVFEFLLREKNV